MNFLLAIFFIFRKFSTVKNIFYVLPAFPVEECFLT